MRCNSHVVGAEYRKYRVCECRRQAFRVSHRTRVISPWKKDVKWTFEYEKELVIREKQREGRSRGGWLFCKWTDTRNAELFQRLKAKGEDWEELTGREKVGTARMMKMFRLSKIEFLELNGNKNGNYTQTFSTNGFINIWLPQETQVLKNDVR